MSEIKAKSNIYKEIGSKKEFYRAVKKEGNPFNIQFPRKALERIFQLYGEEKYTPNSFLSYQIEYTTSQFTRLKTMSK